MNSPRSQSFRRPPQRITSLTRSGGAHAPRSAFSRAPSGRVAVEAVPARNARPGKALAWLPHGLVTLLCFGLVVLAVTLAPMRPRLAAQRSVTAQAAAPVAVDWSWISALPRP